MRSLATELSKSNDVAVLIPESSKSKINLKTYEWKIPFRVMGSSNTYWADAKQYTNLSDKELATYTNALYEGMKDAVIKFRPDTIHCHFMLPSGWVATRIHKEYNIPVIITSHGADLRVMELDKRYLHESLCLISEVSCITSVSPNHSKWIKEIFKDAKSLRVECVPGGTDTNLYKPDIPTKTVEDLYGVKTKNFVLGVGRFQARKGFDALIKAARDIKMDILLVGDGWETENLKSLIKRSGIKNVKLLGFFDPDKNYLLRQLYTSALVVVIPSLTREETLCFVGLEALSSGTPLVASSVGGLPFILNGGKYGKLVEPGNIEMLAQTVNSLISDKKECIRLGNLGRNHIVNNFTWSVIAQRFTDILESLTKNI